MKNAFLGFLAALGLHAFIILFGGLLIPKPEQQAVKKEIIAEVDLDKKEEKKEEEPKEKLEDPVEDIKQEMPDFRELAQPAASAAPALAAVSLSDLGSALSGAAGGDGGWGSGVGFGSGVIGGSGSGIGGLGGSDILAGGSLDSKPSPTTRASPRLPADVRKRIRGKVEVLIIVGKDGAVQKADILESPDPAANAACLEAARQWRFQPGSRDGKPVSFKLKLPFRFD
jgi:periplasmic protein TonB